MTLFDIRYADGSRVTYYEEIMMAFLERLIEAQVVKAQGGIIPSTYSKLDPQIQDPGQHIEPLTHKFYRLSPVLLA